jgi:hypothetical protein
VPLAPALRVHAVEERVHHYVARLDPELGQETLDALARFADQDPACDVLVNARILPEGEHTRAPVEAPTVKDRPPLDPKVAGRVHVGAGIAAAELVERLPRIAGVELVGRHQAE